MVVLFVLCLGVSVFVLLVPYVCFHILVKFRQLSGHLMGKKLLIRDFCHFHLAYFICVGRVCFSSICRGF